ncbi:hypothetical protein K502DRAFT_351608 [Neoconidiobolus thromboides FSU 785]|nr:hypothetical protein K502DRAFT_351608 [Neoconidiobolus thromboides FSU 785]
MTKEICNSYMNLNVCSSPWNPETYNYCNLLNLKNNIHLNPISISSSFSMNSVPILYNNLSCCDNVVSDIKHNTQQTSKPKTLTRSKELFEYFIDDKAQFNLEYKLELNMKQLDYVLIDNFYLIRNIDIMKKVCIHDMMFLKKNSVIPFYKLNLLIICLLTLSLVPELNLQHMIPEYVDRLRNVTLNVHQLCLKKQASFTNYYYIDLARNLFSYLNQ